MPTASNELIELETRFWQSMVAQDTDTALKLLNEPALMVSSHGVIRFDHEGYRKMAEHGKMILKSFEFSGMDVVFPNASTAVLTFQVVQAVAPRGNGERIVKKMNYTSTWVKVHDEWRCVVHTETPSEEHFSN